MSVPRDPALHRLWRWLDALGTGLILGGIYAAAAGWRPAAWILIGAVAALVGGHVWISATAYRRTMQRPWPRVEPVPDDDEDW